MRMLLFVDRQAFEKQTTFNKGKGISDENVEGEISILLNLANKIFIMERFYVSRFQPGLGIENFDMH